MRDVPPALVWPRLLELPPDNAALVYLDLNHWISFAQATTGHTSGAPFVPILEACKAAKSAGSAVFVLSAIHYMEMQKIKDPSQRRAIARVMEELTGFDSLLDRIVLMELELDAMLDPIARVPSALPRIALLGRGVLHCFGRKGGLRVVGPSGDVTQETRQRMGPETFDAIAADADLLLNRSTLQGPADDEVQNLRALGWKPESAIAVGEKRAAQERELTSHLDGEVPWRHGRLRDVIAARELYTEFEHILPQGLAQRQLTFAEAIPNREAARRLVRAMPSTNVSIELKTAWHRNPNKPWTANDVYDIDALSLAVPYCDVVVTEKACHHVLTTAHLGQQMHTTLLRDLHDLPAALQNWKVSRGRQPG